MKHITWRITFGCALGLVVIFLIRPLPLASGQNDQMLPPPAPDAAGTVTAHKVAIDDSSSVPPIVDEVLLAERGKQLAEQLRHLRRIESTLGDRHPSIGEVRAEIEVVRSQLDAWSINPLPSLAFQINPASDADAMQLEDVPKLSTDELRRLILQMAIKMDRLETRIGVLERRQRRN